LGKNGLAEIKIKKNMMKIGMMGMSPNNAHPYSWSSIINGVFDGEEISRLGNTGVSAYLTANQDTLGINHSRVTHIWTQDRLISKSIAKSAGIPHTVDTAEEMIGKVDAVILARDDADNHVAMARPFIEAGIPIFIDKPLAASIKDLDWFRNHEAKGKFIMSCSSMRYSNECRTVKTELASLGQLELVTAVGKKDWLKYGVHMLEAMFAVLSDPKAVSVQHIGKKGSDIVYVVFENGLHATLHLFMNISLTFQLSFFGQSGWRMADIKNSYSMFRENIIEFVRSVEEGKSRLEFSKTENIINTLIGAETSLQNGGKIIYLK
jgi:predicted dehydrogenase